MAIFLEARTIVVDPQGQRLGDRLAQTQVIGGAGARDLVKSVQDWLMSLGRAVGQGGGWPPPCSGTNGGRAQPASCPMTCGDYFMLTANSPSRRTAWSSSTPRSISDRTFPLFRYSASSVRRVLV